MGSSLCLKSFVRFLVFSGAGFLSAVCLSLMLSGRLALISVENAVFLSAFLSTQALGLTLVKCGADQYVYACGSRSPPQFPSYPGLLRFPILPISALYCIGLAVVGVDNWLLIACALSLPLDALGVIRISELSARRKFENCAIATVANNPLFFGLSLAAAYHGALSPKSLLVLYCLTSVMRLVLTSVSREISGVRREVLAIPVILGVQQILNYALFRLDSAAVATSFVLMKADVDKQTLPFQQLMYLLKFPELVAGISSLIGLYLFIPAVHALEGASELDASQRRRLRLAAGGVIAVIMLCGFGYFLLWKGESELSPYMSSLVLLQACGILPANFVTFVELRRGRIPNLVRWLLCCAGLGVVILSVGFTLSSPLIILTAVPFQLLLYIILFLRDLRRKPLTRIAAK